MRIGILTAGGDCPGLNAVIRSVVHRAVVGHGDEVIGFEDGFKGLLDGHYRPLDLNAVSGILARGGTILGSARLERDRLREAAENCAELSRRYGIDALIPIGGEGTLTAARMLSDAGMPVVGVPKTIDNDISSTDRTFGFDTAVGVATEAIDRLKTTAESHQRVMVVEVMGRHAGWIALESGMAGGAHGICLPERPFQVDDLVKMVEERFSRGKKFAVIAASPRARTRPRAPCRTPRARSTSTATSASRASATGSPSSWRPGSARRPDRSFSATFSAAAPRPRTTGCSPPASAGTPWRPSTAATSAG
ncbi:Pyrophosphate--fructose 6-phosphate 1-phosphotransferase [Streptomyces californicus]